MEDVLVDDEEQVCTAIEAEPTIAVRPIVPATAAFLRPWRIAGRVARGIASATEWVFGLISLVLGLSMLAALPVIRVLSLGYFLESSARVAQTGRLRDGVIGVRLAARIGCLVAAIWLALVPAWFVGSYARSAELIDPGGPTARNLRIAQVVVTLVSLLRVPFPALLESAGSAISYGPGATHSGWSAVSAKGAYIPRPAMAYGHLSQACASPIISAWGWSDLSARSCGLWCRRS